MGDVSAEPSMEDILSSIKRIIAEEGEPVPARVRRPARAAAPVVDETTGDDDHDEVLELNDPMPLPSHRPPPPRAADPISTAPAASPPAQPSSPAPVESIVSQQTAAATRGSLDALSRMMLKPEPASDGTLEGLVREMLRPMLREWLDATLPGMVETMVEREIAKITGRPE